MHELAIAESVVSTVLEKTDGHVVRTVRLRVGQLAGVVPDALQFCFELAASDTNLEGATLEIMVQPGRAHCRSCDEDFSLPDAIVLCQCGSADVQVLAGRELAVQSVEVV